MNIVEFTNKLKNPSDISSENTTDLEVILEEFPYFQAAHFLYLNGLKNQNSFKYNNGLKKTAVYTTDRSLLFDYISSNDYNYVESMASEYFEVENLGAIKNEPTKSTKENTTIPEEILHLGKPLQFNFSENHSFNEWLQVSFITPIKRGDNNKIEIETSKKEQSKTSKSNFDLIEKFIATNPKIKPAKLTLAGGPIFDSTIENESLMTETLAHVYLEQKKFEKAITAFTVLSLKYPEKSSFFANQIQAIKKIQEK